MKDYAYATIDGLNGCQLSISKELFDSNPTNRWYVGEKSMYEALPSKFVKK